MMVPWLRVVVACVLFGVLWQLPGSSVALLVVAFIRLGAYAWSGR